TRYATWRSRAVSVSGSPRNHPGLPVDSLSRAVRRASRTAPPCSNATEPPDRHVHVRGSSDTPRWHLYWTPATPATVQLIALYAVLNDDPTAAIRAAQAALVAQPPIKA